VRNTLPQSIAVSDCASDAAPVSAASPQKRRTWAHTEGLPLPLGVTWIEEDQAFNFAACAEHAESVKLFLYSPTDLAKPVLTFQFDPIRNKSGRIWHCRIPLNQMCDARYYGYSVSGQAVAGLRGFNHEKAPLGVLPRQRAAFDWAEDLPPRPESDAIVYELHVKGFTKNPNSGVPPSRAGTYAGLMEKIPYLKELGITVVELMPIFQRDPHEGDYWGYMPLNFFAPHAQCASSVDDDGQHLEFKNMVKAFHKAGIAIVLDVVYNHTCEGDHLGPTYSFKGFDPSGYYMQSSDPTNPYANHSGTGNTLNFSQPHVRKMVMDSLRYWKNEMHI